MIDTEEPDRRALGRAQAEAAELAEAADALARIERTTASPKIRATLRCAAGLLVGFRLGPDPVADRLAGEVARLVAADLTGIEAAAKALGIVLHDGNAGGGA